jgi:hypothetical protein
MIIALEAEVHVVDVHVAQSRWMTLARVSLYRQLFERVDDRLNAPLHVGD